MSDAGTSDYLAYERVGRCPLCSSADQVLVDPGAAVVRCRGCGHRYVDPRPTHAEIARGYSRPTAYDEWILATESRDAMWRRRFRRILGGTKPGRLLDVGAGIGTFLAIARDAGWATEGTEVSTTAIDYARERYGLALCLGSLEDCAPPGPYDAITLWHVLEHVPDPAATLRRCHALLRADGRIVLAMPNDGELAWALTAAGNLLRRTLARPPSGRYELLRPGVESHIQHFDEMSIRTLLGQCDFTVDRITVDDATPQRTPLRSFAFTARRLLTAATPWNFGREMLVIARRRSVA